MGKHFEWRVVLLAALALLSGMSASAQRRAVPKAVEYAPSPRNVDALFERADLVAVVKLGEPVYRNSPRTGSTTHFTAQVVERIRDAGKRPKTETIDVYRHGGRQQTEKGWVDIDELHFARWSSGMTLLLFLVWNEYWQAYGLAGGPDLAFELEPISGKVRSFGRGPVARAWHGKRSETVLAEIRRR